MIPDEYTIHALNQNLTSGGTANSVDLQTIDLSLGRSVRQYTLDGLNLPAKLTISHSESKENKGMLTDRSSVRLEVRGIDPTLGTEVIAQCTFTASFPRSEAYDTAAIVAIARQLLGFLALQNGAATVVDYSILTRILNGEP